MFFMMVIPGVVSVLAGIVCCFTPARLLSQRQPPSTRWWLDADAFLRKHSLAAGISLIALGLFYLSSAYYVWLRLHL